MSSADIAVGEDKVIAAFYCAAVGETDWPSALNLVSKITSCWVVQLMGVDLIEQRIQYSFEGGDAPAEPIVEYARRYHGIDPHLAGLMPLDSGLWYHSADHFDDAAVAVHPFYQDFLIPYGDRYVSGTKLHQDESSAVILGLHRALGTSPLDATGRALVERLGFHLKVAISIWRKQRHTLAAAAIGTELLNRMESPIFLVDSTCRIGVANDEARLLLTEGARDGPLRAVDGTLVCAQSQANSDLRVAIDELGLEEELKNGRGTHRDRSFVRVPGTGGDSSSLNLCLLALRPQATMGAFGRRALAMVIVHDPARRSHLDPFMVAAAYGLSPAEARVAIALASGTAPKRIASLHVVSVATIRTQMKTLYRKLEINSATELAAMLNTAPFSFFKGN